MRKKVTITLDETRIEQYKYLARTKGRSLSQLVEDSLEGLVAAEEGVHSFSEKWRGRFKAAKRKDARYKRLAERFL